MGAVVVLQRRHAQRVSRRVLRYWQVYAHQAQIIKRAIAVMRMRANRRTLRIAMRELAQNVGVQREKKSRKRAADVHYTWRVFRRWHAHTLDVAAIRQVPPASPASLGLTD